jgi:alpha-mannosidase
LSRQTLMRSVILPGVLLSLLLIPAAGWAETSIVWQIGKFNDSSYEFHQGIPANDPVFIVGKSDPAKDWYRAQSGTSNGIAGFRAHPFTVKFELPQAPHGLYTLKFSLLDYSDRVPILAVNVNGHAGQFFQHPVLNYSGAEWPGVFLPHFSKASIDFDVPTQYLQQGTNTLVLTAIDEPNTRDDSKAHFVLPYIQWGLKDPSFLFWKADKEVAIDLFLTGGLSK